MKKFISMFMALAFVICNLSIIASAQEKEDAILTKKIVEEKLSSQNMDVIIDGNSVKLCNPTQENIQRANYLLAKSKTYPTKWVYRKNDDIRTNKKIKAASKSALAAAITSMVTAKGIVPGQVVASATAAFGTYWYLNSDVENVYYYAKYYYRELGPGKFDSIGNFMGDYQIKKVEKISKNSDFSSGYTEVSYKKSTICDYSF